MGINSIKCENYAGAGKTGFGKENKSASDFDGKDILKGAAMLALMTAGTLVAGCIESPDNRPPPVKVEYDKNAAPIAVGRVYFEYTDSWTGYGIQTKGLVLEKGQIVGLRQIVGNASTIDKEEPFSNICRVMQYDDVLVGDKHYDLNCLINPKSDDVNAGDFVALYQVAEAQK